MTDQAATAIVTKLPPRPEPVPTEDRIHGLLNDSIEKIAQGWIDQLTALRANASALEAQVLEAVAGTKDSIRRLHELGAQVAAEATRGQEVIARLSDGIGAITGNGHANPVKSNGVG